MSKQFIKKGDKVILKEDVPDIELNSKAVIDNIKNIMARIQATEQTIQKIEHANLQLPGLKDEIEHNEKLLHDLKKFNDWATEVQLSKLKTLLPAAIETAKVKVDSEYDIDKALTEEQNNLQKYHMFVHYVGNDPEIQKEIAFPMIQAHIHSKTMVKNPWK